VLNEAELAAVATYLDGAGVAVAGPLRATQIPGGRSNLTYRLEDGRSRWVLRMPPKVGRMPSAHDVAREFRVVSAIEGHGVPVAPPVALCEDESVLGAPFAVAGFVDGSSVQTREQLAQLDDATLDALIEALVATLATLHRLHHVGVGLARVGRADGYAARQLRRWRGQWELVGPERWCALARNCFELLEARAPRQVHAGIVHGDYRLDNTLVDLSGKPEVLAVVDWELSTIGDPVADVAMMCAYRYPAIDLVVGAPRAWTSDRLPDVDALATSYEAAGGVPLIDWEFHLALANLKIAVAAAGIDYRWRAGAASGPGYDTAMQAVEPFLERAAAVAAHIR